MKLLFQKLRPALLGGLLVVTVMLSSLYTVAKNTAAQSSEPILIRIVNSSFAPLSTVEGSQVRIPVFYQVNDASLEDQKINGVMKIYSENGTLIRSSSFPAGFIAKGSGGTEVFRTTIRDPAVSSVLANITFIDFARENSLSNAVTAYLTLQEDSESQTISNQTAPFELPGDTSEADELNE
ncbi:MAG TPA: hypothetical protein VH415_04825 [Nitrososphaeraceae archaeon]|jgi:hypothetical protein